MLKLTIDAEAHGQLPDAIKAEYKQEGDSYVLDTDAPSPADLKKARDDRDEARRQRDALSERFQGVDPEVYKTRTDELTARATRITELETELEKAKAGGGGGGPDEEKFERALAAERKEREKLQQQLDAEKGEREKAQAAALTQSRQTAFNRVAGEAGVQANYLRALWADVAGKVAGGTGDDDPLMIGETPVADHVAGLKESMPGVFAKSNAPTPKPKPGGNNTPPASYDGSTESHEAFGQLTADQLEEFAKKNAAATLGTGVSAPSDTGR